jgi:hypothetical protein
VWVVFTTLLPRHKPSKLKLLLKSLQVAYCLTQLASLWFIYSKLIGMNISINIRSCKHHMYNTQLYVGVSFYSYIMCFCNPENYKYNIPQNVACFSNCPVFSALNMSLYFETLIIE